MSKENKDIVMVNLIMALYLLIIIIALIIAKIYCKY
jgi:hypothetical protein